MTESPISLGNSILIRQAAQTDMDELLFLLHMLFSIEKDFCFDEIRQRRGLEVMLENTENRCIMVAECEKKMVAMCSVQLLISTAEGGPAGLVEDLAVHPDFRSMGIGRSLLKHIEKWTKEKGATRLQLLADRNNHNALGFYEKLNWKRTHLICLRKSEIAKIK
ncbi:MAG: GNAT family N-acetyltransferase [Desulfococcaceae bacterium]